MSAKTELRPTRGLSLGSVGALLKFASATLLVTYGLLDRVAAFIASIASGLPNVSQFGESTLIMLLASLTMLLAGSRLVRLGWDALRAGWSRGARIALLLVSGFGTAMWLLALLALAYPLLQAYCQESYRLEAVVEFAKRVDAAMIAFMASSLLGAVSGFIHVTQARGRVGRIAALLLLAGGVVYAYNAYVIYRIWRRFVNEVGLSMLGTRVSIEELQGLVKALARLIVGFNEYLLVYAASQLLISVGFLLSALDYSRSSSGT